MNFGTGFQIERGGSTSQVIRLSNYVFRADEGILTTDGSGVPTITMAAKFFAGPQTDILLGDLFIYGSVDGSDMTQSINAAVGTDDILITINSWLLSTFSDDSLGGTGGGPERIEQNMYLYSIEESFDITSIPGSLIETSIGEVVSSLTAPHKASASTVSLNSDSDYPNPLKIQSFGAESFGYRVELLLVAPNWTVNNGITLEAVYKARSNLRLKLYRYT